MKKKETVEKLLRYNFNRKERRFLAAKGYINGCGGKGGFSFSDSILYIIKKLKRYDQNFLKKLLRDLELLCGEHDIDFTLGGGKWAFKKANIRLAYNAFKLLHWANFFGRVSLAIVMYVLLNRHGKKYFSFGKKKKIDSLFIDFNS